MMTKANEVYIDQNLFVVSVKYYITSREENKKIKKESAKKYES